MTPLRDPTLDQDQLDIPAVTEVWRRGSVVASNVGAPAPVLTMVLFERFSSRARRTSPTVSWPRCASASATDEEGKG